MDTKQIWYGYYAKLDVVAKFIGQQSESAFQRSKVHELFMTWVVARFLQFQEKKEHFVGFPSLENREDLSLTDLLTKESVLDDDNFDTVITNVADLQVVPIPPPIRLQIKRYTKIKSASTEDLSNFICNKVQRYGHAPELSIVFHIRQDMVLNIPQLAELTACKNFEVGSIIIFVEAQIKKACFLFELYPKYTGVMWSPAATDSPNPSD